MACRERGAMNGLALCAGVGAMELGLGLALGRQYRTIGYVEREAYASACLVARMGDETLDRAPVFDDLTTFSGRAYRGRVDIVSAGLPCQPYSVAGAMRGHEDERALWPHFVRIVGEVEPSIVFLENVPAFRKHFEPVWQHLRELGFVWAPPLLQTASESGAPHIRERFFALAAHPERVALWDESGRLEGAGRPCQAGTRDDLFERRGSPFAPDDDDERCEGEWCGWVFDAERQTLRHDPDRCRRGCRIGGSLWDFESPPVRVDARAPGWMDELRAVGNVGAPPVAYASAFLTLLGEVLQ